VLEGKHSAQGIRFHLELGGTVPALVRPAPEDIPPGDLMLADEEDGFNYEAATITITALEIEYRRVTFLLDDEAPDTAPLSMTEAGGAKAAAPAPSFEELLDFLNAYGREQKELGREGIQQSEFWRVAIDKFKKIPQKIWRPAYADAVNKKTRGAPKKSVD
jgi:hypothetical protein